MGRQNAESQLNLPPGFRFYPTDEELVVHYLCKKAASQPLVVPIIAEVDLYKYDPWQLPEMALFGEKEWYFFTPRDRKYPNGSRPNRAAGSGYWKATGADKPIVAKLGGRRVGIKKALVFYVGKAPKGSKTNWIMHEYRLADVNRPARKKGCLRLDDWVLCRIYNKKSSAEKAKEQKEFSSDEVMDSFHAEIDEKDSEMVPTEITVMNSSMDHSERTSEDSSKCAPSINCRAGSIHDSRSPDITSKNYNISNPQFKQNLSTTNVASAPMDLPELTPLFSSMNNNHSTNYNSTNFVPLLLTDSSCSMPSSPEIKLEKEEVQSRFKFAELMQQHDNSLNQPMFNFGFENLQSPFPQLDQIQAPSNNDSFQDFLASLNPGYIQRAYQMD